MPLRRRRAVAWLATIMVACSLVLVPAARTQDTSPATGFCQVWTAEVVAPIIGAESTAEIHPSSSSDSCEWWVNPVVPRSHDPNAPWTIAIIGWEDVSLDRFMGDYPDGHSAQIGSVVGWYGDGNILLPLNDGQLFIGVVPAPGVDAEAAVMTLAELAVSKLDILPAPPTAIPSALFTDGFCGLWSPDELAGVLGAPVTVFPEATSCMWSSADPADPTVFLSAYWADGTLEDWESSYYEGHEVPVGAVTGWFAQDMGMWLPIGAGVMWITVQAAPGIDQEQAAVALGELALERAPSLLTAPTPEPTLPPDPVGAALCALWSPDELVEELGTTLESSTYANRCTWSNDAADGRLRLDVAWEDSTLEQERTDHATGHDVTIGSVTGWYARYGPGILYLPLGEDLLSIALVDAPPGVDPESTIMALAELALTQTDTLPRPPTPAPVVPLESDPELDALVPASVGDTTLNGASYLGARQFADRPPEELQPLTEALSAVGKTLDDVSTLWRADGRFEIVISALRIRDADLTAVMPQLIEYSLLGFEYPQQPATIAGKPVTALTFDSGEHRYLYVHGDVLWMVKARDPAALSEIFAALP